MILDLGIKGFNSEVVQASKGGDAVTTWIATK